MSATSRKRVNRASSILRGRIMRSTRPLLFAFAILTLATPLMAESKYKVLHMFGQDTDGSAPLGSVVFDASGNLYGATGGGGAHGYGTVFELVPNADGTWSEALLHSFDNNGQDGIGPTGGLIFDSAGNLYGTTVEGGKSGTHCLSLGCGTVFELSPQAGGGWTEKVLHDFKDNGEDGYIPYAGLVIDAAGNLYGTTWSGGADLWGTVFELTPQAGGVWAEKILHNFKDNGEDGSSPFAGLVFNGTGDLYGTTWTGGSFGGGTVFELTPTAKGGWTEKVVYNFNDEGSATFAGITFDGDDVIYGTTTYGGISNAGTAFQLTHKAGTGWTEKVLHDFGDASGDGTHPSVGLTFAASGDLYGTTEQGGQWEGGTLFHLTRGSGGRWTETIPHSFGQQADDDANTPDGSLISDHAGNLYGTASKGGTYNGGNVFEFTP